MTEVVAKVRVDRGEVRHAVVHAGGVAVRVERLGQPVRVVVATGAVAPTVMTAVVGRAVLGPEDLVHTAEDGVARLAAGGEGGGGVAVAHSQPGRVVAASILRPRVLWFTV